MARKDGSHVRLYSRPGNDLTDRLAVRRGACTSASAWARKMARSSSNTPCKMGLEGIASKRKDSAYRSGRSSDWIKNTAVPAVKREAEEDRNR
jgi:ATP-dependent DNA ligase